MEETKLTKYMVYGLLPLWIITYLFFGILRVVNYIYDDFIRVFNKVKKANNVGI